MTAAVEAPRALRDVYGDVLVELGATHPGLVVLDAGVSDSTKTIGFGKAYPHRFVNAGIAEANMVDMAAGLALTGKTPFVSTFAIFGAGRAWEQIRQSVAYSNLDVKIVCTHAGISIGEDGGSAQMIEDIALMRVLPNMAVLCPADALATDQMIRDLAERPGPAYVRLGRNPVARVLPNDYRFAFGRPIPIRGGADVAIFATGLMVTAALEAAESLATEGIAASVIDVATIKPLDADSVADILAQTRCAVTAEEHSILGGLGSAIAEIAAERCPVPLERVGVQDRFGMSGKPADLMPAFGLTADDVAAAVRRVVARR
jgi:transketolase